MEWLVTVHSVWRWAVLLAAVGALVLAAMAATGSRPWDGNADRTSFFFMLAMDIQFVIGAVLWIVQGRWNGADTFLSWVHPLAMIAAVALAHVGRARADRASEDKAKGMQAALFFGLSLVIVIVAIPFAAWPL
jgi:hypothetical protein